MWLIPAALGMAFTLLAIPWTAIQSIWRDHKNSQGLDIQQETKEEQEQALRGPGPWPKKNCLYPNISWADEYDEDADLGSEPSHKKAIIGVPLKDVSRFLRSSAPQINSTSGPGQAPSRGCEVD